jgi:hypothetical protein
MATAQDVRRLALALPRAYEALVRDYVKFRVGRIVFLSISPDEELLGFGFPKEERAALVASEPDKFLMPVRSDERYNWVRARLAVLDEEELAELVVDAWRMCVPKRVAEAYLGSTSPKLRRIRGLVWHLNRVNSFATRRSVDTRNACGADADVRVSARDSASRCDARGDIP